MVSFPIELQGYTLRILIWYCVYEHCKKALLRAMSSHSQNVLSYSQEKNVNVLDALVQWISE